MRTRLLRKLRKEAHKLIGIKYGSNGVFYVGRRDSYCLGVGCFSLESAKAALSDARREEIVSMVWKLRQQEREMDIERRNKEYSKL